jgi:hypothetical protein
MFQSMEDFLLPERLIPPKLLFVLSPENTTHFVRTPWSFSVCVTQFAVVSGFSFGISIVI